MKSEQNDLVMGVRAAPVIRPTMEEWCDFGTFVRALEPKIAHVGAASIVPPAEWLDQIARHSRPSAETVLKPIRQHVFGRERKFQAVMEEAPQMTMAEFEQYAHKQDALVAGLGARELEAKFWRGLAAGPAALYGADSSEAGSLFPPSLSVWNLSRLPGGVDDDLLQALPEPIPGLNRSMLYCGAWRSLFAMHTEDCELQGASFLHAGAPKQWYVIPPTHADRVRKLARDLYPQEAAECEHFMRHKTTILSPELLKASNIPVFGVLQTAGTFVIVLSSAFHYGFNHGFNVAEAVNFATASWLPAGRKARPCMCDGQQTPHIDVPLLVRRLRAAQPVETADWWCFLCACGRHSGVTQQDEPAEHPEGEQFECSACGVWGHVECYPEYADLPEGQLPATMHCVLCRDAWADTAHAAESWRFSCVCGRNEGASNESTGRLDCEAPTGRMFACDRCGVWAHTECFDEYRGVDDDSLPPEMFCGRCKCHHAAPATPASKRARCRSKGPRKPAAAAGASRAPNPTGVAASEVEAVPPASSRKRPRAQPYARR